MKCYFCLTAPDSENTVYLNLFELSLKSALTNTDMNVIVVFDGDKNSDCFRKIEQYQLIHANRASVLFHEFSHNAELKVVYEENEQMNPTFSLKKMSGAFLRLDIPFLENEDEFVFYSDIDVYFNKNIDFKELNKPRYLSAAPEFERDLNNIKYFNSGVLLLNVKNMRYKCELIFDDIRCKRSNILTMLDQGLLNKYCLEDMDVLPLAYNWKPYWGINQDAKIIHFHGMKPGGSFHNSGFAMTENELYYMSNLYPESLSGLIYYSELFFEQLGQKSSEWVPNFVNKIFEVNNTLAYNGSRRVSTAFLKQVLKAYFTERFLYLKNWKFRN